MMRGRTDRPHVGTSDYFSSSELPSVKRTDYYWLRRVGTGVWFVVFAGG